jgi:PHD/YefM family antitoxin component YafN of YafNO toxin-antitoxin module
MIMVQAPKQDTLTKANLDSLCKELLEKEEPVVFEWNGHTFALITKDDLEYFEDLEDADDVRAARAVLDEMKATGEKPIPWEEVKEKHGFDE